MVPYNVKASDIGCDIIEFSFEHMCIRIPKIQFQIDFLENMYKENIFACESCSTTTTPLRSNFARNFTHDE